MSFSAHLQKNILAGLVVLTPILVTWLVFEFILNRLIGFGKPWLPTLYRIVQPFSPELVKWLLNPWVESTLTTFLTLLIL